MASVAHVQPVRARGTTASCYARSGGRAGRRTWGGRRELYTERCDDASLGTVYPCGNHEDALSVREAELFYASGALAHQKKTFSIAQSNLANTYQSSDEMKRHYACDETYILDF